MAPVVLSSEFKFFGVILLKLSVEVVQYLWIREYELITEAHA
jgi:hypothetical protein